MTALRTACFSFPFCWRIPFFVTYFGRPCSGPSVTVSVFRFVAFIMWRPNTAKSLQRFGVSGLLASCPGVLSHIFYTPNRGLSEKREQGISDVNSEMDVNFFCMIGGPHGAPTVI